MELQSFSQALVPSVQLNDRRNCTLDDVVTDIDARQLRDKGLIVECYLIQTSLLSYPGNELLRSAVDISH